MMRPIPLLPSSAPGHWAGVLEIGKVVTTIEFIPWEESFFDLFEEQAAVARDCLPILGAMHEAGAIDPQWAKAMEAIEQRGDRLVSSLIQKAEQTFITSVDRQDILALAIAIDDMLDLIEEFTVKLVDYDLRPDGALNAFFELVAQAVTCMTEGIIHLRTFHAIEETPCRAPHHNLSDAGLIAGGRPVNTSPSSPGSKPTALPCPCLVRGASFFTN